MTDELDERRAAWRRRTVRELAALHGIELPDCGGSPCIFGDTPGMRTQGGCRCDRKDGAVRLHRGIQSLVKLAALLDATTRALFEGNARALRALETQHQVETARVQVEVVALRAALEDLVDHHTGGYCGENEAARGYEPHSAVMARVEAALAGTAGRANKLGALYQAADPMAAFLKEHHDAIHMHATHTLACTGEGCRIRALLLAYEEVRK